MYEELNYPPKSGGLIATAINGHVAQDYGGYHYPISDVLARIQEGIWRDLGYIEWADAMSAALTEAEKQRGETSGHEG